MTKIEIFPSLPAEIETRSQIDVRRTIVIAALQHQGHNAGNAWTEKAPQ